jgi:hypothetical protein
MHVAFGANERRRSGTAGLATEGVSTVTSIAAYLFPSLFALHSNSVMLTSRYFRDADPVAHQSWQCVSTIFQPAAELHNTFPHTSVSPEYVS